MYKPCMPSVVSMFLHLRTTSSATPSTQGPPPSMHTHSHTQTHTHTQSLSQKLHFSKNQTIKKVAFLNPPAGCALISDSLRTRETVVQIICLFYITSHVNYNDGGPRKISADKKAACVCLRKPTRAAACEAKQLSLSCLFFPLLKKTKFQVKFSIRMAAWSIVL